MTSSSDRISELAVLLDRIAGTYRELSALAREKVTQMGAADILALRANADREKELVRKAQEQDGLRRQLMEIIGRGWGMGAQSARRMTASQLLQRVEASQRGEIERAVKNLRQSSGELSEAHRTAGLVASAVLTHLREVFAAISRLDDAPNVYAPNGRVSPGGARRIFEATG
jgi:hypothetical protein